MRFVLKLKQPFLHLAIHIHVYINGAGVVLFAHFQVIEQALLAQITRTYGSKFHQAETLFLTTELLAHVKEQIKTLLQFALHKRFVNRNGLQLGSKRSMAAVVAPIGIQNAKLSLGRIALLASEIAHHLTQVIGIHCQSPLLAECSIR